MIINVVFKSNSYKQETYETNKIEIEGNCLFFKDKEKFSCCLALEEIEKITIEK